MALARRTVVALLLLSLVSMILVLSMPKSVVRPAAAAPDASQTVLIRSLSPCLLLGYVSDVVATNMRI
jgi:hypothetical protein